MKPLLQRPKEIRAMAGTALIITNTSFSSNAPFLGL